MSRIIACIDGSPSATAVCDYAAWASLRLDAPLTLLHVLDRALYPLKRDLSGSIGLGSREQLLEELAELDEQRARLARQQGELMLESAQARVLAAGVPRVESRQRHGDLIEVLNTLAAETRLLVIGKRGQNSTEAWQLIGSQVENTLRSLQRPILVASAAFQAPQSIMLAFDGSSTAFKAVDMLATSPLFRGLPLHLVAVGERHQQSLSAAAQRLQKAGFDIHPKLLLSGAVETALLDYLAQHSIDLLVMGAYGHSRIREFLVGSTTTSLLHNTTLPLLIVR